MKLLGRNVTVLCAVAMLCVVAMELLAILNGMNGAALASSVAAVIGLPVFIVTRLYYKRKNNNKS